MDQKKNKLPDIDSLWDYNDPVETEKKFRELYVKAQETKSFNYSLELKTQIARAQGLQLKFQEAHETLNEVELYLDEYHIVLFIRYYLERGRTYNSENFKKEASDYFSMAYQRAIINEEDYYAVDAAHMLAISEPDKAMEWNLKALELCEKSENTKTKKWLGLLYNNIGWSYHSNGEYINALELFEKALDFKKKEKDEKGVFVARWTIAKTFRSLDRIEEALDIQYELLTEIKAGKVEADGYVYEEIGECLLQQGKIAESFEYFKIAFELLSQNKWIQTHEPARLERLAKLIKEG